MRILKFEFLKIITNKRFMVTLIIFLIFNLLFLNYQNYVKPENGIFYKAYKILESDLKGKTHKEKGTYIYEIYERAKAINIIYDIQNNAKSENPAMREYAKALHEENKELYNKYYEESKNPIWRYTKNGDTELSFLQKIKSDYDTVNNYQGSLNEILENADTLKSVSIFKSKDEVSLKSIIKTASVYKGMLNTKIDYEIGKAVQIIAGVSMTDFFVLILVFVLSTILMTEEKEKNLFVIIKSTKNGQEKTIISKIISLFVSVCLICILFYGMNFIYYLITLGYGNLFSTIQSVPTLLLSTFKINIVEYLLLLLGAKCLYLFLLALLTFYLAIKWNSSSEVVLILLILVLFNFLLYKNIDITSCVNLLKSFNLINLINTNEIFRVYDNLRFYSIFASKASILCILQGVTVVLLIVFSIHQYLKSRKIMVRENVIFSKLKKFKLVKNVRFNSIFSFEAYKLLFVNKGLIIIILFSLFIGFNFKNQNFNLSYNEIFYKNYMDILKGNLNLEKEKLIENTIKDYDKASEELARIREKLKNGELSNREAMLASQPYEDILATREIFTKIEQKYAYIKENPKASFVYDTGYYKLFRVNKSINEYDIYLIITTIIFLLGLFIMEYKTEFIHILNTTKKGRVKTARKKVLVTILGCTLIYIISIIPEILGVLKMYGLENGNMSIISLEVFHNLPACISIFSYLIAFYIVRYMSYILVILIIEYISLKLKNFMFAFITSIFVLLTPFLISILKIVSNELFPLMNLSIIANNLVYLLFIPTIVMISFFLYNNIVKRLE